ncbi:unnamed protein product [Moneuplotes crassus]|uniref:Uncharacterized protein n=1 Tax=Euplotes crassus TaxID=5936 RepID=A0AAD1XXV4_EUPCR|nr:unnamed protein product [Moneuplotes crassus]
MNVRLFVPDVDERLPLQTVLEHSGEARPSRAYSWDPTSCFRSCKHKDFGGAVNGHELVHQMLKLCIKIRSSISLGQHGCCLKNSSSVW